MEIRNDLPEGVGICQGCGEIYTDELTLSAFCEICEYELEEEPADSLLRD